MLGGAQLIDMKTGQVEKNLIGRVAEGVNDVRAQFTAGGQHVLYYHSGHQTLRAFRVADGQLVGTLRPHARITTWTCDQSGQLVVVGGQDGSLLTVFLYDDKVFPEAQKQLARLQSRRYLAEHLNLPVSGPRDPRSLRRAGGGGRGGGQRRLPQPHRAHQGSAEVQEPDQQGPAVLAGLLCSMTRYSVFLNNKYRIIMRRRSPGFARTPAETSLPPHCCGVSSLPPAVDFFEKI